MTTPLEYPERVSYEGFLRGYEESYAEYVDGVIRPMTLSGTQHQHIVLFLAAALRAAAEEDDRGAVFVSPTQMKIGTSGRQPDVLVLRRDTPVQIEATHVDGPADLVIEMVSPESGRRDRVEKLREYEACGVGEYWTIDPLARTAEIHRRGAAGRFEASSPERLSTPLLPRVSIDPEWLWREEPPKLMWVLREWGLL